MEENQRLQQQVWCAVDVFIYVFSVFNSVQKLSSVGIQDEKCLKD